MGAQRLRHCLRCVLGGRGQARLPAGALAIWSSPAWCCSRSPLAYSPPSASPEQLIAFRVLQSILVQRILVPGQLGLIVRGSDAKLRAHGVSLWGAVSADPQLSGLRCRSKGVELAIGIPGEPPAGNCDCAGSSACTGREPGRRDGAGA